MKKLLLLLTAFIVLVLLLSAFSGCQEENLTENTKKARFIGNENRKLKVRLDKCQTEIEKCRQEKVVLQHQRGEKTVRVMNFLTEQNRQLEAQNEQLKQQLEELKNRE